MHPPSARTRLLIVAALVAAAGGTWLWWAKRPNPDPSVPTADAPNHDPRLTFSTPYLNVRPDVKYVGDAACAECHALIAGSYSHHPMGLAMAPTPAATPIEQFDSNAKNPFTVGNLRYSIERRGKDVIHRETVVGDDGKPLAAAEAVVPYVCGSGARARSYVLNRDGYLFQSPLTWFPHGGRWDLSPSYETRNQHFTRPIAPGCLFCHCNYADHVPGTTNRYRGDVFQGFAIGCERCHGPGELHVKRHADGPVKGIDPTIVNPKRLEHGLKQAVCEQCHVQGDQRVLGRGRGDFDYRPGLPLYPFLMDFINAKDREADTKFVNSVEQMRVSKCFTSSQGADKLSCSSCHDAHRHPKPEEKASFYRSRCLTCHTDQSCSVPVATRKQTQPDDSCVACHMPQTGSEVNHTSITDHRIPRKPGPMLPAVKRATPGPDDLEPYHRDQIKPGDPEAERNRGLAVIAMLDRGLPDAVAKQYAAKALPLLEAATARDTQDWPAWEARADALWVLGRREEVLPIYEKVLAALPESEKSLQVAGTVALELGKPELARVYLERAAKINPYHVPTRRSLAVLAFRRGDWPAAQEQCRQALKLEPTHVAARSLLVQSLLAAGAAEQAQTEFAVLLEMTPAQRRQDLRSWYEQQRQRFKSGGRL